jgi:hypothetical protein
VTSIPQRVYGSTTGGTWQQEAGEWLNTCARQVQVGEPVPTARMGPPSLTDPSRQSVWYTLQLPVDSRVRVSVTGTTTAFFPVLAVYTGDELHQLRTVGCSRDQSGNVQGASVAFDVKANVDYRVQIHGSLARDAYTDGDYVVEFHEEVSSCVVNSLSLVSVTGDFVVSQTGCQTYMFVLQAPDGTLRVVQSWDQKAYWTWPFDIRTIQGGDYVVIVLARAPGSLADYDAYASYLLRL